jgi:hypothetical protein
MIIPDWGALLGGIAGVVGGGVAIRQAFAARKARTDAQAASAHAAAQASEANAALHRMAKAQESIATASRPNAWGLPRLLGGDGWMIRNSSGHDIVLLRVESSPRDAHALLEIDGELPRKVPAGALLEFAVRTRLNLSIPIIMLVWHFANEPESVIHTSQRTLPPAAISAARR